MKECLSDLIEIRNQKKSILYTASINTGFNSNQYSRNINTKHSNSLMLTITFFTHVHKYRTHRTFITNIHVPVTTVFVLMFIVYFLDKDNSETEAECVSVLIFFGTRMKLRFQW